MNQRVSSDSVKEESGAGEEHGNAVLVGCVDRLLAAHRAALNHHYYCVPVDESDRFTTSIERSRSNAVIRRTWQSENSMLQ